MTKIAIVGAACRFPGGVDSLSSFWDVLSNGRDVVTSIPDDRFDKGLFYHPDPSTPGRSYTFAAGTLGDVSGFDASFFGISAREAEQMDPQQRLLLEMTYEAMERGGQVPEWLAGTSVGVYVGISATDYANVRQGDVEGGNAYFMLGSTLSIAANRLSYFFDLRGPSMAIDTACSSALVALHEAVQSLRDGRCPMAVVGSVNVLLSPYNFMGFSKARMLAPGGRCRTFDRMAEGYVRAEGGGVLLLKRLDDAERDGDPILGVIRGIGINTDGRTKGIALPSSEAQEALLRKVYRAARVKLDDIAYFEAHGTGTAVGDPAEAGAIGRAIGRRRKSGPLPVGSVKSNIGHLEPAAGMAGVVKALLTLKHRTLPPTLHYETPNPETDFASLNLAPVRSLSPIEAKDRPILVGVNSFGFGGANAHVILEEYRQPLSEEPKADPVGTPPLYLTARSEGALRASARRLAEAFSSPDAPDLSDTAWTLAHRRDHHDVRLVARGMDPVGILREYGDGGDPDGLTVGEAVSKDARVGLIFGGNGSQWAGMGSTLMEEDAVFRSSFLRIDALVRQVAGWSLVSEMAPDVDSWNLDDTQIAQPMLFALQVALVESLRAKGLRFEAVAGHSVGEVAAAWVAGALDLEQSVRVIVARSEAQGRTRGQGRMMAVGLPPEDAVTMIEAFDGRVEIAAFNSPVAITLSGEAEDLEELGRTFESKGISFHSLDLDYAFHNKVLDPVEKDLMRDLEGLALSANADGAAFYSTVSGDLLETKELDAGYWWRNARDPVRFGECIAEMCGAGIQTFLEIGPHPILQSYIRQTLREVKRSGLPLPTLVCGQDSPGMVDAALDKLFVSGAGLDMERIFPGRRTVADLPTYPWQREKHWFPRTPEARGPIYQRTEGSLLGSRPIADATMWESLIDPDVFPFLGDHRVGGSVVFPASGFLEIVLEAAQIVFKDSRADVENLDIQRPLIIEAGQPKMVRTTWNGEDGVLRIESRRYMHDDPWSLHAKARLGKPVHAAPGEMDVLMGEEAITFSSAEHYAFAESLGLDYGPSFQTVRRVSVHDDVAVVELEIPRSGDAESPYLLHPALFDGCLQALFDLMRTRLAEGDEAVAYLPYRIGRCLFHGVDEMPDRCLLTLTAAGSRTLTADFVVMTSENVVVAEARNFRFLRSALLNRGEKRHWLYETAFEPVPLLVSGDALILPLEVAEKAIKLAAQEAKQSLDLSGIARAYARHALKGLEDHETIPEECRNLLETCHSLAKQAGASSSDDNSAPDGLWRDLLARHSDHLAELLILGQAGRALPRSLCGFSGASPISMSALEHLFDSSPTYSSGNIAVVAALENVLENRPAGRHLRILEVGAGTRGLTRRLLTVLPKEGVTLTVTDPDEENLARLAAEIESRPNVVTEQLDILDLERISQTPDVRYDIVIAAFLLHDVERPLVALEGMAALAAPGGLVLMAEVLPALWRDLAFGWSERWWRRHDNDISLPPQLDQEMLGNFANIAGLTDVMVQEVGSVAVLTARNGMEQMATKSSDVCQNDDGTWVIVAEPSGTEIDRVEGLATHLHGAFVLSPDEAAAVHYDGVVFLAGLEYEDIGQHHCWTLASLAGKLGKDTRLVVVTSGAHDGRPGQAALWGLGRVLCNERPDLKIKLIDIKADNPETPIEVLSAEILSGDGESEIILGPSHRFAPRLRQVDISTPLPLVEEKRSLSFTPGSLDSLSWDVAPRRAPGAGEVEVAVSATGVNFRDIMFSLGVLPDEAVENGFAGATIGMEASGAVVRVGSNVVDLKQGDGVFFFAPSCFSNYVTVPASSVVCKPAGIGLPAAATIPTVFFTVYYALHHLARLQPGERILIHGGAGGVGLAAIQYARHVGAQIFTTVGTSEKRAFMALYGVPEDRIFDSRTTIFADQIMAVTDGEGIDVVLNSLAGEAIHKSLSTLCPFGRFLELGKRDFFADSRIGLRPFRNNISYFGIDADQLMSEKPKLARKLFDEMKTLFEEGVFTPLPYRMFDHGHVVQAFRHMQQSLHIGKIVVTPPAVNQGDGLIHRVRELRLDADATYMVTGGTTGFGFASAVWLAEKGARHVVLVSRRGVLGDDETRRVQELAERGVRVDVAACDVTDAAAVETLFAKFGTRLKGLIHAATVYEDALVSNLTEKGLARVFKPKARGAWLLHKATSELPLDFFVVYSSISTLIGNPGQANYAAANAAQEAIIEHRRRTGLPAMALCLGPISDVGYLARNADMREGLENRSGIRAMTSGQALKRLEHLMLSGRTCSTVAEIDWRTLNGVLPILRTARFRNVYQGDRGNSKTGPVDIWDIIEGLSPPEVHSLVTEMLSEELGHIFGLSADRIDPRKPLFDMGMDSLMALELKLAIEEKFGVDIPPMALSEGGTLLHLVERVCNNIIEGGGDSDKDEVTVQVSRHGASEVDLSETQKIAVELQTGTGTVKKRLTS